MRELLLTIHISAVAAWLGANLSQLVMMKATRRRGGEPAVALFRGFAYLGALYYNVAGVTVFLSGLALLFLSDTVGSASSLFVSIGFFTVVFAGLMGAVFFIPRSRAVAEEFKTGDHDVAEKSARAISRGLILDTALVLLTIAAMVGKWGL